MKLAVTVLAGAVLALAVSNVRTMHKLSDARIAKFDLEIKVEKLESTINAKNRQINRIVNDRLLACK